MHHFRVLENLKVTASKADKPGTATREAPARSPSPQTRNGKKDDRAPEQETNISNKWRIYAKMEGNYHLTNKFALFFNMSKYYKSIGRDPFDVLPLSYHIKSGTSDPTFFKFMQSFKEFEDRAMTEEDELLGKAGPAKREREMAVCSRCEAELDPAKHRRVELARTASKKGLHSSPLRSRLAAKGGDRFDRTDDKKLTLVACPGRGSIPNLAACPSCGAQFDARADSPSQPTRRTSLSRRQGQARNGQPSTFGKSRFSNNQFDRQNAGRAEDEYQTLPRQSAVAEESCNGLQKASRLESLGGSLMAGQSVQLRKNLTLDPQEQETTSTKFPQIGGSKNTQVNNTSVVDPGRPKPSASPRVATLKDSKEPSQGNIWIVKPGENSNRGNGITVCSKLREIKQIVSQSDYDKRKTFILQKYIEKPALYRKRKFDIRCFGMLTLVNNKLKGFVYDNGYLRTSSRPFVNSNLNNKLIHLTNDAVQKHSEEYGRFESGNKLSFGEYQAYLNEVHSDLAIDFRSHIFSQIKQIMTDTFRATYKVMASTRTLEHHTFEILGYDFMLDEDFKVYLIEVNTNPCLETTCPLLQKLITDLVDSGLRIALDPLYPPPNQQKRMNTQISVLQWQLSFDEDLDIERIERIQGEHAAKLGQQEEDHGAMEEDLIQECEDEGDFD